jgi:hypothetical protein
MCPQVFVLSSEDVISLIHLAFRSNPNHNIHSPLPPFYRTKKLQDILIFQWIQTAKLGQKCHFQTITMAASFGLEPNYNKLSTHLLSEVCMALTGRYPRIESRAVNRRWSVTTEGTANSSKCRTAVISDFFLLITLARKSSHIWHFVWGGWAPESPARENAKIQMAALIVMDLSSKYHGTLSGFWRRR